MEAAAATGLLPFRELLFCSEAANTPDPVMMLSSKVAESPEGVAGGLRGLETARDTEEEDAPAAAVFRLLGVQMLPPPAAAKVSGTQGRP